MLGITICFAAFLGANV